MLVSKLIVGLIISGAYMWYVDRESTIFHNTTLSVLGKVALFARVFGVMLIVIVSLYILWAIELM